MDREIMVTALKDKPAPLYCKTGRINEYRRAFYQGNGGSPKDKTFDPAIGTRGGHSCCGSKVWWRHKLGCKNSFKNAPEDLSDLKDVA